MEVSIDSSGDSPRSSLNVRLGMILWPGAGAPSAEVEVTLSVGCLECHSKPAHRMMNSAEQAKRRSERWLCGVGRSCRRTRGKDILILSSRTRDTA